MLNFTNYTLLLIGLIYVTILPGFVLTELFLPKFPFWKKLPLYTILSVIVSTIVTYLAALVFGFNRITIFACFLIFFILLLVLLKKRKINILTEIKKNYQVVGMGILVYVVFFASLYPGIFSYYNGNFVMSGPNWQDTAMHLSIIESISQGNFPPQAPYFSGQPLSYYYFADLHAAIVNKMFGNFFPKILVILNPFLAMAFFFSVFAVSYQITRKKWLSIIAGIIAVFYGNLGFVSFFKTMFEQHAKYLSFVTNNPYNFDQNFFQMVPMADYFLQNRPMMVGLPAFLLTMLLLLNNRYFLAGIVAGSLAKFQMFGFVVSSVFFAAIMVVNLLFRRVGIAKSFNNLLKFTIPNFIFLSMFVLLNIGGRSVFQVFKDTFKFSPWQERGFEWFFYFLVGNLGIGFLVYLMGACVRRVWKDYRVTAIYLASFFILAIPLSIKFTIYEYDMLKFFYYLVPLISILVAVFYSHIEGKKTATTLMLIVFAISSITSINLLFHSALNKFTGYSFAEHEAGIWIRKNVPQKSVFVTMPTVHSAVTDIAGRLRIISYINWPYSHGFDTGNDNVFTRVRDVEKVYNTGEVAEIKLKYNAKYIYLGREEKTRYPGAGDNFDYGKDVQKIYEYGGIEIYEIL